MPFDDNGHLIYDPPYSGECKDCDFFEKLKHDNIWSGFGKCNKHISMNYFNDFGYPITGTPIVFKDCSCAAGVTTE